MAILKGFPPSNRISTCRAVPFECELCGKEFSHNFPLRLCLGIDGQLEFSIIPCPQCYEIDQGRKYWSDDLNKWGDNFDVYSKAREEHTYWEILWKQIFREVGWQYFREYKIVHKIAWCFKNPYKDLNDIINLFSWPENTILLIRANKTICEKFDKLPTFKKTQKHYGTIKIGKWECHILHDLTIPEHPFKSIFIEKY